MTKEKINLITKDLFNSKKEKDCLTTVKGKLAYNGKILTTEQVQTIVSQAKEIRSMDLYQLLCSEMEMLANKKMYFESDDEMGILFGKACLWTIDVLRKKVDKLAEM